MSGLASPSSAPESPARLDAILSRVGRVGIELLSLVLPVGAALGVGAVLVEALGEDAVEVFRWVWWGAFGTQGNLLTTLRWATPLILSGLAVSVAYRAGLFNMGGEGQIYAGALAAAMVGVHLVAPAPVHLPLALLTSCLAGALYALIPALLRVYLRVNEIVTTLMFNYLAVLLTELIVVAVYFSGGAMTAVEIATPRVAETAALARLVPRYPLTWGIFVSVAVAVLAFVLLRRTVWGYEVEAVGASESFARYAGVRVAPLTFGVFLLSGAIAGLAGGLEVLGPHRRFVSRFATNLGFDGILVALLGRTDPLGMIAGGLFLAAMKNGFMAVERLTEIDRNVAIVLQATILLFVSSRALINLARGLGKGGQRHVGDL